MKRHFLLCAAIGAVCLFASAWAHATIFGVAGEYNAFILNDLDAIGGDTEGRLAAGRNATMQWYSVGSRSPDSHGTLNHLVVGNDLNAIGKWQVYGGNTVYGGQVINAPSTLPPNTISQGNPIDFAAAAAHVRDLAAELASLPANGSSWYQWSTLNIVADDPVLNVVTIDPAHWAAASDRQITAPAGSTLIINIPGSSHSMQGGLSLHGVDQAHVLYNFFESTSIDAKHIAVLGSVLAPYATVSLSGGSFDGNTIAFNAIQRNGGEFHNHPFVGIPEPATGALLLCCSAAFLLCRRRG
ncbi:MAG TPA: choice-of-anchor A family protein [Phycisphaerae bacterium]|nr:choice-of-anchor A family protein [Phycisphaerae bacterium]HOQ84557.1 choice-of-anchor A family protein [Phycisphaerae bacterium]